MMMILKKEKKYDHEDDNLTPLTKETKTKSTRHTTRRYRK